jgi:hypothetical protein
VTVLLDSLEDEEEEVKVAEMIVVLRMTGDPVPMLGVTTTTAVVLVGGVGGEVWIDTTAVRLVSDELKLAMTDWMLETAEAVNDDAAAWEDEVADFAEDTAAALLPVRVINPE